MSISPIRLPFERDALEPYMSEETLDFHYGKHHFAYATKLGELITGTDHEGLSLEAVIVKAREENKIDILNNASQVWNHDFFWQSLTPQCKEPTGKVRNLIERDFGSLSDFKQQFRAAATSLMGSGWVWLAIENGKATIHQSGAAETLAGTKSVPVLTLDVWEHAYYIDFRNRRADFVDAYLDELVNWDFAARNLEDVTVEEAA